MKKIPFRREFGHVKKNTDIARHAEEINGPDNTWHVFSSSIMDYEQEFSAAFSKEQNTARRFPLHDFVAERRREGKPTIALDLMSDGRALEQLRPDVGLAVTLTDPRKPASREQSGMFGFDPFMHSPYEAPKYGENGIDLIAGDVFDKKIWQQVAEWLKHLPEAQQKFDLIIARALGGLRDMPDNPDFHIHLLQQLWDVLSDDGGTILVTVPNEVKQYLPAWSKVLTEASIEHSFELQTGHDAFERPRFFPPLRLVKKTDSAKKLPGFSGVAV